MIKQTSVAHIIPLWEPKAVHIRSSPQIRNQVLGTSKHLISFGHSDKCSIFCWKTFNELAKKQRRVQYAHSSYMEGKVSYKLIMVISSRLETRQCRFLVLFRMDLLREETGILRLAPIYERFTYV